MPPYVCACCNVLASAYISDKFKRRGYVNAFNFLLATIGFIILETTQTPGARYVGTFFAAMGAFPCVPITIAWNANNIQAADAPKYRKGHAVMIGLNTLSFVCMYLQLFDLLIVTWIMIFWLKHENKKRVIEPVTHNSCEETAPETHRYII